MRTREESLIPKNLVDLGWPANAVRLRKWIVQSKISQNDKTRGGHCLLRIRHYFQLSRKISLIFINHKLDPGFSSSILLTATFSLWRRFRVRKSFSGIPVPTALAISYRSERRWKSRSVVLSKFARRYPASRFTSEYMEKFRWCASLRPRQSVLNWISASPKVALPRTPIQSCASKLKGVSQGVRRGSTKPIDAVQAESKSTTTSIALCREAKRSRRVACAVHSWSATRRMRATSSVLGVAGLVIG
jgi:hypothetical protein